MVWTAKWDTNVKKKCITFPLKFHQPNSISLFHAKFSAVCGKIFYGWGVGIITSNSAAVNEPGYGSNHHAWSWHSDLQAAAKAVFLRVQHQLKHTGSMCFHFLTFQIQKFAIKPLHGPNFHRTAARLAEHQGHERFFRALAPIFSNNGKLHEKKRKNSRKTRRGWVVFILVFRLLHFPLCAERLPDKCIPNW